MEWIDGRAQVNVQNAEGAEYLRDSIPLNGLKSDILGASVNQMPNTFQATPLLRGTRDSLNFLGQRQSKTFSQGSQKFGHFAFLQLQTQFYLLVFSSEGAV